MDDRVDDRAEKRLTAGDPLDPDPPEEEHRRVVVHMQKRHLGRGEEILYKLLHALSLTAGHLIDPDPPEEEHRRMVVHAGTSPGRRGRFL